MFAEHEGSVAAPTAGLHFTPELLGALDAAGIVRERVTLHVGAGTFLPVTASDTTSSSHARRMRAARRADAAARINAARARSGRIARRRHHLVAHAGNARQMSRARSRPSTAKPIIFITPGYQLQNGRRAAHQFPSAALDPVHAGLRLLGLETMKRAYAEAIATGYRFYSYGDACLLFRRDMSDFRFEIHATDGAARTGVIHTPRGDIRTPAFMPVGTAATRQGDAAGSVRETGADILLGNTYHLMLRPGAERIARLGGLHRFMDWERPILTDSGGFQVMSLSKLRKITEEGVRFRSHIDGAEEFLSPERAMEIQRLLGSDIQMVLDECPALPADEAAYRKIAGAFHALGEALARRHSASSDGRACFGIVQGGIFPHLRQRSAEALMEIGFDGYAVGGLAVGEGQAAMFDTLDATVPHLPADRPRYLMGVGKPDDIVGAVLRGIDMFDCVLPTRSGRNGQAFTCEGALNLRNAAPCGGSGAARRRLPLPGLPPILPRLSASCGEGGRDHRHHAAHLAQSRALPAADVLSPPRHGTGHPDRICRRVIMPAELSNP